MKEQLEAIGARVRTNAPLNRMVYWRVGGAADFFVEVDQLETLQKLMALAPVTVIGNGSNALVHDAGIRGVVLRLKGDLA